MARVALQSLTKVFEPDRPNPRPALRDVSLAIAPGELLAIVGPSGCGKSTTLRLIAGLEQPTSGSILLDDAIVNQVSPHERDVAMVFQNHALYPHLNVHDNVAFGLRLRRCPSAEILRRVREAAEALGLAACLDRLPRQLSGGERQRVALARALVRRPRVLLLDEPLSQLDTPLRAELRAEILRVHRMFDTTVLHVTHDQEEAMSLGHRVAVMNEGRLEQVDTPAILHAQPATRFVAGFLGALPMTFFEGYLCRQNGALVFMERSGFGAGPGAGPALPLFPDAAARLVALLDQPIVLGLRCESFRLPAPAGAASFPATVERVEALGAHDRVWLRLGSGGFCFTGRAEPGSGLRPGGGLYVACEMERARFFAPDTGRAV